MVAGNSKIDHPEKENQLSKHVINVFTAELLIYTQTVYQLIFPLLKVRVKPHWAALGSSKLLEPLGHLAKSLNIILAPQGGYKSHSGFRLCEAPANED